MSVHTQLAIAMNALKDIALMGTTKPTHKHDLTAKYALALATADKAIDKVLAEAVADALHQEFPEEA